MDFGEGAYRLYSLKNSSRFQSPYYPVYGELIRITFTPGPLNNIFMYHPIALFNALIRVISIALLLWRIT